MPESNFSPEKKESFARVTKVIYTSEQEYVDPEKRYAHNDLYPITVVKVVRVEGNKVLAKDDTGEFWIPKENLEFL